MKLNSILQIIKGRESGRPFGLAFTPFLSQQPLAEKLAWISGHGVARSTYIVEVATGCSAPGLKQIINTCSIYCSLIGDNPLMLR